MMVTCLSHGDDIRGRGREGWELEAEDEEGGGGLGRGVEQMHRRWKGPKSVSYS